MHIKIKYPHDRGTIRVENDVAIREIFIHEDLLDPKKETIALGFTNDISSGIIEFSIAEFDRLQKSVKNKIHLLKGVKVLKFEKE